MRIAFASVAAISCITATLVAQARDADRFEVASIKRSRSVDNAIGGAGSPDTYRRTNATLLRIVMEAYSDRFLSWEVIGGPSWLDTDKFDVVAKADGSKVDEGDDTRAPWRSVQVAHA